MQMYVVLTVFLCHEIWFEKRFPSEIKNVIKILNNVARWYRYLLALSPTEYLLLVPFRGVGSDAH